MSSAFESSYSVYSKCMNTEEIRQLADSMRIEVSKEELDLLVTDFASVLGLVDQLNEVAVSETEPQYRVKNVIREDVVSAAPSSVRNAIVRAFPEKEGDLLKVPAILH